MQIHLEAPELYAVQSYSNETITINGVDYHGSLIVSKKEIITDLQLTCIDDIDNTYLTQLTKHNPKIIIIGHKQPQQFLSINIIAALAKHQIGIECMSLSAACSTFNVLLNEGREVVGGFIL